MSGMDVSFKREDASTQIGRILVHPAAAWFVLPCLPRRIL